MNAKEAKMGQNVEQTSPVNLLHIPQNLEHVLPVINATLGNFSHEKLQRALFSSKATCMICRSRYFSWRQNPNNIVPSIYQSLLIRSGLISELDLMSTSESLHAH